MNKLDMIAIVITVFIVGFIVGILVEYAIERYTWDKYHNELLKEFRNLFDDGR